MSHKRSPTPSPRSFSESLPVLLVFDFDCVDICFDLKLSWFTSFTLSNNYWLTTEQSITQCQWMSERVTHSRSDIASRSRMTKFCHPSRLTMFVTVGNGHSIYYPLKVGQHDQVSHVYATCWDLGDHPSVATGLELWSGAWISAYMWHLTMSI